MTARISSLSLVSLALVFALASSAWCDLTNGLVLHYTFDANDGGVILDQSGNGWTGVVHGTTWTSNGVSGGACDFTGTNSYVDLGATVCGGVRTISLWFNSDVPISTSLTSEISLIVRDGDDGSGGNVVGLLFSATGPTDLKGRLGFNRNIGAAGHYLASDSNQ